MVTMRSRRLEGVFGALLADVEAQHVLGLVEGAVREDFDLDFKAQMYGGSDADKRDLASDVAALANSAGGVLVLGVEEDEHAQAVGAPGIPMSEEVDRRILQVAASISPAPPLAVRRVPLDIANPGHGFVLVIVPRSLARPHAVVVNATSLRYPVRNGTTTRYLTSPEVAAAYRQRTLAGDEQPRRAVLAEAQAEERLASGEVWIQVSLVPELPGDSWQLNTAALRQFEQETGGRPDTLFGQIGRHLTARTGHRRLVASPDMHSGEPFQHGLMELHIDGTGTWAISLWNMNRRSSTDEPDEYLISDEGLVEAALSGASVVVKHARDRAGAAGQALLRVRLLNRSGRPVVLGHTRSHGFPDRIGGTFALRVGPLGSASVDIDEMASSATDLIAGVHSALTDVVQSFGSPDVLQVTRNGELRWPYWNHERRPSVRRWAEAEGVTLNEATL